MRLKLEYERESSDDMLSSNRRNHYAMDGIRLFYYIEVLDERTRARRCKRIYMRCYFRAKQPEALTFSSKRENVLITLLFKEGDALYKLYIEFYT